MLKKVTASEARETIREGGVSVLKFGAAWCSPCRTLDGILEKVDHTILKVDVDEEPKFAQDYGVMSIPSTFIIKNGIIKNSFRGLATAEEIDEMIREA